jgi:hypothetical protein
MDQGDLCCLELYFDRFLSLTSVREIYLTLRCVAKQQTLKASESVKGLLLHRRIGVSATLWLLSPALLLW